MIIIIHWENWCQNYNCNVKTDILISMHKDCNVNIIKHFRFLPSMSEFIIFCNKGNIYQKFYVRGVGYHSSIYMNQKDILKRKSFKILKY